MLVELGWDEAWADALSRIPGSTALAPARVTAVHRGRVRVVGEGLDELVPVAGALESAPAVGDWVSFDGQRVSEILPRRSELARADSVLAANVDLGMVVVSFRENMNLRRLERFVALIKAGGIESVVVLTKEDLSTDPDGESDRVRNEIGAEVLVVSAQTGSGMNAVRARLRPRSTTVLMGMSGVGKSTLLNELLGEARQRTLPVRARDGAGRHATVHRELFALSSGALVIDSPGVRLPALATAAGVRETFSDVEQLARECRFADCRHGNEPGCAVRGVVSDERLGSMRKLEREGRDAAGRRPRQRDGRRGPSAPGTSRRRGGGDASYE